MKSRLGVLVLGASALSLALSSAASADAILGGDPTPSRHQSAAKPTVTVSKAGTSVVLGSVAPTPATAVGCGAPMTIAQAPVSGSPSYTSATGGVLTSFSHNANGVAGQQVRAVVVTPGAAPGQYSQVGKSAPQAVTPSSLNTFATRIPVPAGAVLGMQFLNGASACAYLAAPDTVHYSTTFNPDNQTDFTTTAVSGVRLNVSGVLEPDADGDGYGDASQDLCPQSKLTQSACPAPDTTVTKKPKKSSTNRKVKIKFSSTIAGSTFTCAVDKKAAKPCTSPFKKKFKYGKHKVVITAISAVGIVDATPVTVKFKVKKP